MMLTLSKCRTTWFNKIPFVIFPMVFFTFCTQSSNSQYSKAYGAIVRGDSTQQKLTLVFTGDSFADGAHYITKTLKNHKIKAAFFFTGNFYGNPDFKEPIRELIKNGHYLGAHSYHHLLYCDWDKRDSLLVNKYEFTTDLKKNYKEMERLGIPKEQAPYFLPPYEWYNDTIAQWTKDLDLQLINMTHGTLSHADYTTPKMCNYKGSAEIHKSILHFEEHNPSGLNGFMLLMHFGTEPTRKDKFYHRLDDLITTLKSKKYEFVGLEELLALP
jgi:peptidoglycan/xylan/chitin deacetylase (PgdA/CDA1 family)